MKEKHQNGVIQHEPFEVPEGTLMFLIKATCDSVGLELYLVFAEHMNCHGWPNAASTQFSASQRESTLYSSTFDSLILSHNWCWSLDVGRCAKWLVGFTQRVATSVRLRSHLGGNSLFPRETAQTLNYSTQLPHYPILSLVQPCRCMHACPGETKPGI